MKSDEVSRKGTQVKKIKMCDMYRTTTPMKQVLDIVKEYDILMKFNVWMKQHEIA
jgi:hypothetical protein